MNCAQPPYVAFEVFPSGRGRAACPPSHTQLVRIKTLNQSPPDESFKEMLNSQNPNGNGKFENSNKPHTAARQIVTVR